MRSICIHGHFYQPPRENPWLEAIELQESALPYHDWNERIAAECYAPNGSARILDARGRILKIVNNYGRISFNFGPTLLTWMENEAPETYATILDGDRQSVARFNGHGSAMAQPYNHVIMPLASRRDRETQILWGISDFEARFQRKPEGMWLPETAVDLETLELMSEAGIRFTVLAPYQAKRVRRGQGDWKTVGESIDTTRPYLCRLPSGREISIFFYDSPASRAVAFEGLLNSGERFADRLMSRFATSTEPQIVNIATDGESYGHHHRYGDMALAFALDTIDRRPEVKLTNYAEYLSLHPPADEVEIAEYTSWSCAHGVERWRSDCGCSTGGDPSWHQRWRKPLRAALDWLSASLAPLFEEEGLKYIRDPWSARNHFISVVRDRSEESVAAFFAEHAVRPLERPEIVRALQLFEMQRHAMLMYTSCGWFFNEVSGIETVQVLQYAARACQLALEASGSDLEPGFLELLESAESNVPRHGNARAIYEAEVRPAMLDLPRVAGHFAVSSLFHEYAPVSRIYCYEVDREDQTVLEGGRPQVVLGRIRIQSIPTRESRTFTYGVLHLGELNLTGAVREFAGDEAYQKLANDLAEPFQQGDFSAVIRELDQEFSGLTFSVKSLFGDEQRRILDATWNASLETSDPISRELYERYVPLMRFHAELGIPLPRILRVAVEFAFNMHLRRLLDRPNPSIAQIKSVLQEVRAQGIELDQTVLSYAVTRALNDATARLDRDPSSVPHLKRFDTLLELVAALPFGVDLWKVQNVYYRLMQTIGPEYLDRTGSGDEQARIWLRHFRSIGNRLAVRGDA